VHYQLAHGAFSGTGYKLIEVEGMEFKVLMGTDPAEVEDWRNQRRKKFPTAANIAQKKKDKAEYLQAGGIDQKVKSGKKKEAVKRSREGEREEAENVDQKRQKSSTSSEGLVLVDENKGIEDKGSEEEEEEEPNTTKRSKVHPCRNFRIGKCRRGDKCKYIHSLSHGKEERDTTDANSKVCSYFLKGKCRRGSQCHFSHSTPAGVEEKAEKKEATSTTPKIQSLYLKLVESEVHKEENILLQCIRFLINENFLTS